LISFIVPAYNEERLLPSTLRALHAAARATGERYEVIVADDASTDRTAAVAEENDARVVRVAHRQIAATRNSGARIAAGDFLVFVDADTVVNEAVVAAALRTLRDGAAGGGAAVRFEGSLPSYARLLVPLILGLFRIARLGAGCFLFCRHQAFEAVGGFDERLYGSEEIAMSRGLKRQGRFVVLRDSVITSGRKLRAHSGWEMLRIMGRLAFGGPRFVRSRRGLAIWYEERREDPDSQG
jgi:glycosyltransferase involved in cell wall biosynthesis